MHTVGDTLPMDENWAAWSQTVVDRIRALQRKVNQLETDNKIYRMLFEHNDGDEEPRLIRVIQNTALELVHQRQIMTYCGTWNAERLYDPGATVSCNGAAWVCQTENTGVRPGDGVCWKLAIKSESSAVRKLIKEELAKVAR